MLNNKLLNLFQFNKIQNKTARSSYLCLKVPYHMVFKISILTKSNRKTFSLFGFHFIGCIRNEQLHIRHDLI